MMMLVTVMLRARLRIRTGQVNSLLALRWGIYVIVALS